MVEVVSHYHDLVRVDIFPVLPSVLGRVLDLGGGVGATSCALKKAERATFVAVADQVADEAYEDVDEAYGGDLEDEAFLRKVIERAGPFDTILALDILEHLRDPWNVVRWLQEGLAPDGVIVASIPNVNYRGLVLPLLFRGRFQYVDAGLLDRTHIRWFARHGAIELMSADGMGIEIVMPTLIGRKDKILDKLTFGRLTRFFARQYIIRARRK